MADEERDLPQLDELAADITTQIEILDKTPPDQITPEFLMGVLRNTVLPLMKDLAETTDSALVELDAQIDPVKISRIDAAEIVQLMQAFKTASPGQTELHDRIDAALIDLTEEEDDEEPEEEES